MGTAGDWADEWTEKSWEQVRRMANRAVSKVFMMSLFCGEELYNRVGRAGDVRERVRRFTSYLLSKRSQKGKKLSQNRVRAIPARNKGLYYYRALRPR